MFKKNYFAILFLLIFSTSAFGQSITLESVDGTLPSGNLPTGELITFYLRLTNDATRNAGITNGFSISSPEGATWGSIVGDTLLGFKANFDLIYKINHFSTGEGVDTIGFGGAAMMGAGIVANFDEVAYSITIGPIPESQLYQTIILDSVFFPPSGAWKWAGPDQFPSWDGPHHFQIGDIGPPNTPPVLDIIGVQSAKENELLSINITASDNDGDALSLSAFILPTGAQFIDNGDGTGVFNWTPNYDQEGSYDITFLVSDDTDSDQEIVSITVDNTNRAPVLASIGTQYVDENENLFFSISATDLDLDQLSLSMTSNIDTTLSVVSFIDNGNGTASFSWTPNYEQAGTYEVVVTVTDSDGHYLTDNEFVTIKVNNINRPPVLTAIGNKTVDEGQQLLFYTPASDPDGDIIKMYCAPLPEGAVYEDIQDGSGLHAFTWTPDFTQAGSYELTFSAYDDELIDKESITITVNNIDNVPILSTSPDSIYLSLNTNDTGYVYSSFLVEEANLQSNIDFNLTENISWLTLVNSSGTTPETINLSVSNPNNGETVFIDSIMLSSADAVNSPYYLKVVFEVLDPPKKLVIHNRVIKFVAIEGHGNPPSQKIAVSEFNNYNINFSMDYNSYWTSLSDSVGVTPDSIEVIINIPESLPFGERYFNTIHYFNTDDPTDKTQYTTTIQLDYLKNDMPILVRGDSISTIRVSETLNIPFSAHDNNGDPLQFWLEPSLENTTFVDDGNGEFHLEFIPTYAQIGEHKLELFSSDGIDTASVSFSIQVSNTYPDGDFNLDNNIDISDLTDMVSFFFLGGYAPEQPEYVDLNNDEIVDISDLIEMIKLIFY